MMLPSQRRTRTRPRLRVAVRRRSVPSHFIAAGVVTLILLALSAIARAEPRTLDTVTIEGEVRLPEVLFITSRDVARPMDWLDHYAGPASEDVAASVALPFDLFMSSASPGNAGVVAEPLPESATEPASEERSPETIRSTEEETR